MVIFIAAFKAVGWSFADVNTQLSAIDPNLVQPFNESGLYSLSGVIAMPFYLFVSLVANPYCTIRLMAMTNVGRKSFKKFGLTLISVGMICMLMYMFGLFGRVLYPNLADADSVIPTIAQNLLPEWGLAIVAVGLFASMMACVDSMIHCISAMLSVDIYKRTLKKDATDQQVAKAARYITFAVVAIVLVITLFYTPKLLAMLGMIAGAGSGLVTLAPMLVGLYWERALEIDADIMFKATNVDGVYDKDPHKFEDAKKYDTLSFDEILSHDLKVMDGTAASLCRDNSIPILVFNLDDPQNIVKAIKGENVGTVVK